MNTLAATGIAFFLCGMVGENTGHMKRTDAMAMFAVGSSFLTINRIIQGDALWATLDGAFTAFFIHSWWNNGGGDDTKRRLKEAAKKFQPTRRTAPVGGA